ncbi:hypothetical protein MN0502_04450 [Arthrobacter sp. MN05-02]|nr:hypothetical protein MN0502_04450 [Arthrobacter sp. MN05-02]
MQEYTLFNEPFSTLFLCGHEAIWPPYHSGLESFVDLLVNVLPAVAEASRLYRELLPGARHVWVDTCEFHTGSDESGQRYADMANDRRFLAIDAFLGRGYDVDSQLGRDLAPAGGERLLTLPAGTIDVLGLDYYAHCQWNFSEAGGAAPTPTPLPLADQVQQYWERYGLPCMLTETNVRGATSDRATWLKYVLEQCEEASARGVTMDGVCWFPRRRLHRLELTALPLRGPCGSRRRVLARRGPRAALVGDVDVVRARRRRSPLGRPPRLPAR